MTDDHRDPDAILARLRTEAAGLAAGDATGTGFADGERGRLMIYFGFAAGVGKTYAMLADAQRLRGDGIDVVAGYVEPHGRAETERLVEGLEVLPTGRVEHRGASLREFDLDAALRRRPAVILVDELAHTNAPGSRHEKRFQDVLELLDAGIDVYTTMNVQHLESLNDVVAQITGVRQSETVPDTILEKADEVRLIDISPDDLLRRLREGKVYIPAQAQQAISRFFTKPNLIALREIALRRTADRVNAQVLLARRGTGSGRVWGTRHRLVACVGPSPTSARVVRTARRLAVALGAEWIAVSVETSLRPASAEARERVARHLAMAERLGAEVVLLSGHDPAAELLDFAASRNVTQIVVGKSGQPVRGWWRRPTLVDRLVRDSADIDVHVIQGQEGGSGGRRRPRPERPTLRGSDALSALGVMTLALGIDFLLDVAGFGDPSLVMVLLLGVAVGAARYGVLASVGAAFVGVLMFNFFFTAPRYTFVVDDPGYVVTFAVMLGIGVGIAMLVARVRRQAALARAGERRTLALYRLNRRLASTNGAILIARAAVDELRQILGERSAIWLPDPVSSSVRVVSSAGPAPEPEATDAAQWVFEHGERAGVGTSTLPRLQFHFVPLETPAGRMGVIGLVPANVATFRIEQQQLLDLFASQVALSLARDSLAEQGRKIEIEAETERMRATLLGSVSHDLRTPLAVIAGTAETLVEENLSTPQRRALLQDLRKEALDLSRLVDNLLGITRFELGGVVPNVEAIPIEELLGTATARLRREHPGVDLRVEFPRSEPPIAIDVDATLIEQLLANLVDNAVRHGDASRPIRILARTDGDRVEIAVEDEGPGLPLAELEHVFGKFHRGGRTARSERGVGLGLAICKAIADLHGVEIEASNVAGGGARFSIRVLRSVAVPSLPTEVPEEKAIDETCPETGHAS